MEPGWVEIVVQLFMPLEPQASGQLAVRANPISLSQAASGYHEHWPHGRGVFHNPSKTFVNWVNEGDHLRIISMQDGGDGELKKKRKEEKRLC